MREGMAYGSSEPCRNNFSERENNFEEEKFQIRHKYLCPVLSLSLLSLKIKGLKTTTDKYKHHL